MAETAKAVVERLKKEKNFVFLIGNGVNRYVANTETNDNKYSWENLLNSVVDKLGKSHFSFPGGTTGMTCPEFFSLIECLWGRKKDVKTVLNECMEELSMSKYDEIIANLQKWGCPTLTTNYDNFLDIGKRRQAKHPKLQKNNTHYPLFRYYAEKPIHNASDEFAIWHIHGTMDTPNQLIISYDNYLGYAKAVSSVLNDYYSHFIDKNKDPKDWSYANSWIYPFLTKPLFIVGLKLDVDEIFLRWLLIRRKYLLGLSQTTISNSYYAYAKESMSHRKRFFLEQVGIKPLKFKSYEEMYETLFGNSNPLQ